MPAASLVIHDGETPREVGFSGEVVVGRGAGADLPINDPTVSRRHALIRLEGTTVVVEDLNSANGTLLNSQPVRIATRAEDGDRIKVGAVELELRVDPAAPDPDPIATPTQILRADGD